MGKHEIDLAKPEPKAEAGMLFAVSLQLLHKPVGQGDRSSAPLRLGLFHRDLAGHELDHLRDL